MNNIILKGRLTKKPQIEASGNGTEYINISVAVPRRFDREKVDFVPCSAFNKTAVFIATYFEKGQEILINGSLQSRTYIDNDGNNRIIWGVVVNEVDFCGSKPQGNNYNAPNNTDTSADESPIPDYEDNDLPF